jgi:hypothetical protein
MVATNVQAIPPDAKRFFCPEDGSHVAMVPHPKEVTKLIETAAQAVKVTP